MSQLTLWNLEGSPPARAVRIVADILGLDLQLKQVDFLNKEHKTTEYMQRNPLGTIPVLEDGDFVLTDSHAIMKYLLEKYGGPEHQRLYPVDLRTRALVDQCLYFDTGVFFIRLKVVALPTVYEGLPGPTPRHIQDIEAAYQVVESYLRERAFLAADYMTLADISVGMTTAAMQPIHKLDETKYPRTSAWLSRLYQVPQFKNNAEPGAKILGAVLEASWQKNKQ